MRNRYAIVATILLVSADNLHAQKFPEGFEGELYYAPRIDLISSANGEALAVSPDGVLDEEVWSRASWHENKQSFRRLPASEVDFSISWAAVADAEFLYVAWKIRDDKKNTHEDDLCLAWMDDSIEIYVDMNNDGPTCPGPPNRNCYGSDDAQFIIGAERSSTDDGLVVGGLTGGDECILAGGPASQVIVGSVQLVPDEENYAGWRGEVAIRLNTDNSPNDKPYWSRPSTHQATIGFNLHAIDDDAEVDDHGNDHRQSWSSSEPNDVGAQSFRNPSVFGKLQFLNLNEPWEYPRAWVLPGDVNIDGDTNISDSVAMLNYLFTGTALEDCLYSEREDSDSLSEQGLAIVDFNDDNSLNIADAIGGLNSLFGAGQPHALGQECILRDGGPCGDICAAEDES